MRYLTCLMFLLLIGACEQKIASHNSPQSDLFKVKTMLDSVYLEDQKYRSEENKSGDSSNLVIIEKILEKYGWLGSEQIGKTANSTFFFVIQHANNEVREKHFPMMKNAVKEGKADARHLALLEDRIALGNGELQIYGSQIGIDYETGKSYVLPLFEPEKVNERREKVGLGLIEDYISNWNLEWDVEDYRNKLPKRIEMLKR